MLQSITWLILIKLKKKREEIIRIRKRKTNKIEAWKESNGGCGGGSDCSASRVLSYYITRRATKEDLQLKTYHHRNCTCEIHTTIP